jgi:hypothetical protein
MGCVLIADVLRQLQVQRPDSAGYMRGLSTPRLTPLQSSSEVALISVRLSTGSVISVQKHLFRRGWSKFPIIEYASPTPKGSREPLLLSVTARAAFRFCEQRRAISGQE